MRTKLSLLLAGLAAASGISLATAPAASSVTISATVPNYVQTNLINQCHQTNGAFVRGIPVYCHRVIFLSGTPNRNVSLCQRWV
ncbi:MAG: hypothetical protein WAW88_08135 [Nocardioides sp.]